MRGLLGVTSAFVLTLIMAGGALAQGQIAGSLHDFTGEAWATPSTAISGDLCTVCHTPHSTSGALAPLWNHDLSTQTFTMYTSNTLDATAVTAPDGESAVCLGCHDGQTALNAYGGGGDNTVGGGAAATTMSDITLSNSNSIVGTNLQNDHPISIVYQSAIDNGDVTLNDTTITTVKELLRSGKVQCASCHDPHGRPGLSKFVRVDNTASALCTRCHNK